MCSHEDIPIVAEQAASATAERASSIDRYNIVFVPTACYLVQSMSPTAQKVLDFIQKNPGTTRNAICYALGKPRPRINRIVASLVKDELIRAEPTIINNSRHVHYTAVSK